MEKPLLNTLDLEIGYQNQTQKKCIQSALNLSLYGGELICLIGPNGSGKSTLLKTLGNILPPLSGEVRFLDQSIHDYSASQLAKRVGLVLTERLDTPHLLAEEIIALGRYPYTGFLGKLREKDHDIITEVAHQVGVESLLKRPYDELSDGEAQKVMIAKVLAQQTPIMLLDEPTAFLDFPTKAALLTLLRKIAQQKNLLIILSTHDIELALKLADKLLLFPKHEEIIFGVPEDLVLQGTIKEVFQNEDIFFNMDSGHFESDFIVKASIEVNGVKAPSFWLKKALQRNHIGCKEDQDWKIHYQKDYQISYRNENLANLASIEEVLKFLKERGIGI
ncbi:MAG: hypothetical protein B7C24_01780 [Bacteroidetes bacterium 4572_77]|nr:MAG: hypothetical protein B7C24_01780 [Bacteroidetes bacterium 4572_77]